MRHPHHYKIAAALAISAGSWGIYWLPQRILEDGGLTGGWGTIAQMIIGVLILSPIAVWRKINGRTFGLELPIIGLLCLLYTSPSPRDKRQSRMPSSA